MGDTEATDGRAALRPTGGRPPPPGRPALLAGSLVVAAGLIDTLSAVSALTSEPYVVVTDGGLNHLHTSGWGSFHLMIGLVTVVAGVLVMWDRAWTGPLAVGIVALASVVDLAFLPFDPFRSLLGIGFEVAAVVVLLRHGRLRLHPPH